MSEAERLEAARWVERLADGADEADYRLFDKWRESPGAAAAYADMARTRCLARDVADAQALQSIRRETLSRVARRSIRLVPSRRVIGLAAVAAGLLIALPVVLQQRVASPPVVQSPASSVYTTGVGERMAVALADGSRMTLDTSSRVRVAYTPTMRRLEIETGQALFEVASRQSRPFIVTAQGREVVAHGTAFDVRLDPGQVRVALIEGTVSVAAPGTGTIMMQPEDVLTSSATSVRVRRDPAAVDAITSWRAGRVEAEDLPLAQVAAEMNRYTRRPILVDPAVAALRISGSFRAGDLASFVDVLQLGFPVDAVRRTDGMLVLKRRG